MTTFLFIRHGESTSNTTPEYICGQSNHVPLTDKGAEQARLLGLHLSESGILPDAIFSSGAVRADATARIALGQTNLDTRVNIDNRVLEMSQGECEGLLRADIYTQGNIDKYAINTDHGKFSGGESLLDVQERMFDFIEEQSSRHPEGTILIFSHGLAIRSLTGKIRGLSKQTILEEKTGNVSLTVIESSSGNHDVRVVGQNLIGEYT